MRTAPSPSITLNSADAAKTLTIPFRRFLLLAEKAGIEPSVRASRGRGSSRLWNFNDLVLLYCAELLATRTGEPWTEIRGFIVWMKKNRMIEKGRRWAEAAYHDHSPCQREVCDQPGKHSWEVQIGITLDLNSIRETVRNFLAEQGTA